MVVYLTLLQPPYNRFKIIASVVIVAPTHTPHGSVWCSNQTAFSQWGTTWRDTTKGETNGSHSVWSWLIKMSQGDVHEVQAFQRCKASKKRNWRDTS